MRTLIKQTAVLFLIAVFTISAQKKDYSNEPGYVNFGSFEDFQKGDEVAEIMIEEHLLKMVAKLAGNEDAEMSSLLGGLKLVKVNTFEVNDNNKSRLISKIKNIDAELMDKNWDRIVRVKKKTEIANIYIKTAGDNKIEGLVVTTLGDDNEAAFVNIVGNIDLDSIGRLSEKFNIPELGKLHRKNKKHDRDDEDEK